MRRVLPRAGSLLLALAVSACSNDSAPTRPAPVEAAAVHSEIEELDMRLSLAMAARDRPSADKKLDATRKPISVLEFLGIGSGMAVLDVNAGGGYYTELLAAAVGPNGVVYAQNDVVALEREDNQVARELDARLAGNRLPNVFRLDEDLENLELEHVFDAGVLMVTLHDIYNLHGELKTVELLRRIRKALKPGAVLGVIDHVAEASQAVDPRTLHRIEEATAFRLLQAAGFAIDGRSDALANPKDPHDHNVMHESVRDRTDRFILRARA